ncbi:hypothetical protein [Actinoplanes regularis]|uniref:Ferredoxin n=1 Tax=Actinoplanes regularis TaxID=52697 RepID=A0A238Z335_9ACTN|nr:hypothetical protein [Actinoplanes regularis]GIE85772.1 hypothetical protein Are01nite_22520 [Actinoplanes regularis]SNR77682.1 hypothetical protein SAMN06264365_105388 [Actinoplanes regularis]
MTRADTLSERQEYLRGGFAELACERCAAVVLVRKSSPQQTSVQWTTAAARQCVTELGALVPTCPGLRASIDQAVRTGRLEVP